MKKTSSLQYPVFLGILMSLMFFSFIFFDFEEVFKKYTCLACQITNQTEFIFAMIGIYAIRIAIFALAICILLISFTRISFDEKKVKIFNSIYQKEYKILTIVKIDLFDTQNPYVKMYSWGFYSNSHMIFSIHRVLVGQNFFEDLFIHLVNKNPNVFITDAALKGFDPKVKDYILKHSQRSL